MSPATARDVWGWFRNHQSGDDLGMVNMALGLPHYGLYFAIMILGCHPFARSTGALERDRFTRLMNGIPGKPFGNICIQVLDSQRMRSIILAIQVIT